ncbi:unnamed protein product [Ectocarpus fasciculatus]
MRARGCYHMLSLRRPSPALTRALTRRGAAGAGGAICWQTAKISAARTHNTAGPMSLPERERCFRPIRADKSGADPPANVWDGIRARLARSLRRLLRALEILFLWSPVVVSGSVLTVLQRLPLVPKKTSKHLLDVWWAFVLNVITKSGPTFIKAGQWVSTRRDTFPEQVCTQLGKLHSFTRTSTRAHGEGALQQAFGVSWRQFLALEDEPLGSGCVASVYKGHIFAGENAGKVVAVKVLHPGIKKTVQLDLELMRQAAEVLEHVPFLHLHWLSLVECVDQFASLMEMQMDLRQEAANLERFTKNFEDDPTILFPNPVYPWVHESVLTEDFLRGDPVSDFFPSKDLAHKGLQAFLKMAFLNNFVHGDLHPGNLMVERREDNGEERLIFLDAGIVCELDEEDRRNFCDLFHAVVVGEGKRAGSLMVERARNQRCQDPDGFCEGVDEVVQRARSSGMRLGEMQAGDLLGRIFRLCLKHEVKLESKFARTLIAIAVLEGVGRSLDPDLNLLTASLPVVLKATAMNRPRAE